MKMVAHDGRLENFFPLKYNTTVADDGGGWVIWSKRFVSSSPQMTTVAAVVQQEMDVYLQGSKKIKASNHMDCGYIWWNQRDRKFEGFTQKHPSTMVIVFIAGYKFPAGRIAIFITRAGGLGLQLVSELVKLYTVDRRRRIQGEIEDLFQEKLRARSRSTYYAIADATILRFMVDVCWVPMLAAFSVTMDQSDVRVATNHC
ncbi:hypothetical protein R6Q59_018191 [Mikania micrantha]